MHLHDVYKSSFNIKSVASQERDNFELTYDDYMSKSLDVLKTFCESRGMSKNGHKDVLAKKLSDHNVYVQNLIYFNNAGLSFGLDSLQWTREDFDRLPKTHLQDLLKKRGIPFSGSKWDLITRLLNNNKLILKLIDDEENRRMDEFIMREAKKLQKEKDKNKKEKIVVAPVLVNHGTQTQNFGTWTHGGTKYLIDGENNLYNYDTHEPIGRFENPIF